MPEAPRNAREGDEWWNTKLGSPEDNIRFSACPNLQNEKMSSPEKHTRSLGRKFKNTYPPVISYLCLFIYGTGYVIIFFSPYQVNKKPITQLRPYLKHNKNRQCGYAYSNFLLLVPTGTQNRDTMASTGDSFFPGQSILSCTPYYPWVFRVVGNAVSCRLYKDPNVGSNAEEKQKLFGTGTLSLFLTSSVSVYE